MTGPDPDQGFDTNQNAQLDEEETLVDRGVDSIDEGTSPPERPWAVDDWGTTPREEREGESIDGMLARELPDVGDEGRDPAELADDDARGRPDDRDVDDETGEYLGDTSDTDGELIDDGEVGEERSGRLAATGGTFVDDDELFAHDEGLAGGAASAEEAAVHTIPDSE